MKQPLIVSTLVIGLFGATASGLVNAQYGSSDTRSPSSDTSSQSDAPKSERGSSSVGKFIDDATVTTRVKSRFAQDDQVSAMNIGVETNDGVVQLSGYVGSEMEKSRAAEIAGQVPNVRSVNNGIIVRGAGESGTMERGGTMDRGGTSESDRSGGSSGTSGSGSSRY